MSYSFSSQAYEFGNSSGNNNATGSNQVNQIAQDLLTLSNGNNNNSAGFSSFTTGANAGFSSSGNAGFSSAGNAGFSTGNALTSGFTSTSYGLNAGTGLASSSQQQTVGLAYNANVAQQYNSSQSAQIGTGAYVSEIEGQILRAQVPVAINETEEITVNGERGIWANRAEVANWRGVIPIDQYIINVDQNPEIITKRSQQQLEYIQELAIRYLRPPTPPPPGEIIIKQDINSLTPPAPPLIIRQQPARPSTPEPLVIREAPPQPPAQVGRKVITISGKRIPPPPRKVIIERLPQIPVKPQSILIERWLPYAQVKRRVIFQGAQQADAVVMKPRNVIIQWEAPQVQVRREVKYLGVIRANPAEYVQRYGTSLKAARELPQFVLDIKTPEGLVLAADYQYNQLYDLEGDLQALKLVDLDREGLGEYRAYLQRMGISYNSNAQFGGASSSFGTSGAVLGATTTGATSFGFGAATTGANASSFGFGSATTGATSFGASNNGVSNELIEQVLRSLDRNNDNKISREEAEKALLFLNSRLNRNYGEEEVSAFFTQLDVNGDGFIDFDEFKRAFLRL